MNDKMRKASQLVIGGAIALSLVTGCAKVPDSTPAISQPAVTEPSATTKATKPAATSKPTQPTGTTKATTAPSGSKATEPSATTLPPETKPAATTAPTQAPTTAPTAAPTTAPTEAPTTAPTEATTAPTEAPQISLDYNEAMAAGNAYGVSAYGWIYDPNLGWDDGFEFASWYSLEEIAEGGGQTYLNNRMERKVRTTFETLSEYGSTEGCAFNCYCYESNGFVYFYVFYG